MLDAQPDSLENKKGKLKVYLMMIPLFHFLSYPEGYLDTLQEAERLAHELGDEEGLLQIHVSLSYYHTTAGNPALGLEYAEKCFNSAEKMKDFGLMAQSARQICAANFFTADVVKVVDIGGKAIHLLEEHLLEKDSFGMGLNPYSSICSYYGVSLGWTGGIKEGSDVVEKGFRNAFEINDKYVIGMTQMFHSTLTYFAGYGNETIAHAQKAIKIYEEAEISLGLDIAWFTLGGGYLLLGEYEKAIDAGEKSLKLAKEFGIPFIVSWSYWFLAMTLRVASDLGRARECAEEALKISQECNSKGCEGMARVLLGCMVEEMTPATIEEAHNQIRYGISILEDNKIKILSALGYLHLGEFLTNVGQKEESLENLKKAEDLYCEMEVTPECYWLVRTQDALKRLGSVTVST